MRNYSIQNYFHTVLKMFKGHLHRKDAFKIRSENRNRILWDFLNRDTWNIILISLLFLWYYLWYLFFLQNALMSFFTFLMSFPVDQYLTNDSFRCVDRFNVSKSTAWRIAKNSKFFICTCNKVYSVANGRDRTNHKKNKQKLWESLVQ